MQMRDILNIMEQAASPQFYMHATSIENAEKIAKEGLIPNGGGDGNYEDSRWISLEGVYATNNPGKIWDYLRAHGLQDYALILIEVDPATTLPDEDTIDILLDKAFEEVHHSSIDTLIDDGFDPNEHDLDWKAVGQRFHVLASGGQKIPYDEDFCTELADWWGDHKILSGENIDPWDWMALKDKVVRHYPNMAHPTLGSGWSIRHPGHIGFEGPTRIVAIIADQDNHAAIMKGTIPSEAVPFVSRFVEL